MPHPCRTRGTVRKLKDIFRSFLYLRTTEVLHPGPWVGVHGFRVRSRSLGSRFVGPGFKMYIIEKSRNVIKRAHKNPRRKMSTSLVPCLSNLLKGFRSSIVHCPVPKLGSLRRRHLVTDRRSPRVIY